MIPEAGKATNSNVSPVAARVDVDIGKSNERKRSADEIGNDIRERLTAAGRRRSARRAGRHQQRRAEAGADPVLWAGFAAPDGDHERLHGEDEADPGRGGRRPFRAGAEGRAAHRASIAASPTTSASRSVTRRTRCASPSRASRSATGSTRSARRATWPCACIPKIAWMPRTSSTCPSR